MRKTMIALRPAPESLAETRERRTLSGGRRPCRARWLAAATALVALVCAPAAFGFHPPSAFEFRPVPGSPFATGNKLTSVAFSPSGRLLAAANYPGDRVSVGTSMFSVAADGALTEVAGSPFATGFATFSVAFNPSGRLLATGHGPLDTTVPASVSVSSVARDGALTPVPGSPFAAGDAPSSVAFSPSGRLLAAANFVGDSVSVFSVTRDGGLSEVAGSPFAAGDGTFSVAFSPSGRLLATANGNADNVSVFSVGQDGALTEVVGSPFPAGDLPQSLAFSPSGRLLATQSQTADTVSMFSVARDGALTPVAGSPFAAGDGPVDVAFSPRGGLLAVANVLADSVSLFSVARDGTLTTVPGSPLATGDFPFAVAFSPSGELLAVANRGTPGPVGGSVSVFAAERCRRKTRVARFGVATECGMGRKPAELVPAVPASAIEEDTDSKDVHKGTIFWDPVPYKEYAVKESK